MAPVVPAPQPTRLSASRISRPLATLAALAALAACGDIPNAPMARPAGPAASHDVVSQVFMSGTNVMTWDAIPAPVQPADWPTSICGQPPQVGLNANWQNPHNAFVVPHPWAGDYFAAPWINAWNHNQSWGGNSTCPYYNWRRDVGQRPARKCLRGGGEPWRVRPERGRPRRWLEKDRANQRQGAGGDRLLRCKNE